MREFSKHDLEGFHGPAMRHALVAMLDGDLCPIGWGFNLAVSGTSCVLPYGPAIKLEEFGLIKQHKVVSDGRDFYHYRLTKRGRKYVEAKKARWEEQEQANAK